MDTGSGANHLCLVEDPQWGYYEDGKGGAAVFGAEYRTGVSFSNGGRGFFGDALNNQDAVCAVCRIPRTTSVMIPGRNTCYQGWSLEYRYR